MSVVPVELYAFWICQAEGCCIKVRHHIIDRDAIKDAIVTWGDLVDLCPQPVHYEQVTIPAVECDTFWVCATKIPGTKRGDDVI